MSELTRTFRVPRCWKRLTHSVITKGPDGKRHVLFHPEVPVHVAAEGAEVDALECYEHDYRQIVSEPCDGRDAFLVLESGGVFYRVTVLVTDPATGSCNTKVKIRLPHDEEATETIYVDNQPMEIKFDWYGVDPYACAVIVQYADDDTRSYNTVSEAEEDILETVTGCDFATQVQSVDVYDPKTNKHLQSLGCEWSLKLVPLGQPEDPP